MKLNVKGRNAAVPESTRQYAEKKLAKLDRYFRHVEAAQLEQTVERGMHVIELNLEGDGVFLRSEERSADPHAAVDAAVDKIERQIKRFKTRTRRSHERPGNVKELAAAHAPTSALDAPPEEGEEEPHQPRVTRRKRFPMKPMSPEEAADQMELVDHTFFLFHNEETGEANVLYRRRDGDYGLIEPER